MPGPTRVLATRPCRPSNAGCPALKHPSIPLDPFLGFKKCNCVRSYMAMSIARVRSWYRRASLLDHFLSARSCGAVARASSQPAVTQRSPHAEQHHPRPYKNVQCVQRACEYISQAAPTSATQEKEGEEPTHSKEKGAKFFHGKKARSSVDTKDRSM